MSDEIVQVALGERSYDIHIGEGIRLHAPALLPASLQGCRRFLLISDSNISPLYAADISQALIPIGAEVREVVVPAGETTKSVTCLSRIWEAAVEARLDRHSAFVALGGGVVGDLAGFAAATYLRGVPFVQVPTSLLAMVDSAVGGKTGMNLPQGKNLVGAFHQPARVVADLDVLQTLPPREFSAGMAEVIKYGVIYDAELFSFLEANVERIRSLDRKVLAHLVKRSCEIKAEVVRQDEREGGLRAILNFGHTLGHAIENVVGYGEWLHGEAIAAGMVYAARVSERVHGFPAAHTQRLINLFRAFDLPVDWSGLSWQDIFLAMTADKKARDAVPRFVLAKQMGEVGLPEEVALEQLQQVFEVASAETPPGGI
jgi:3-dehydroquinate synthase